MTGNGVNYDVLVAGMPFLYAITDQQPYVRATNDYKRQQIDTSPEPGEQTLSQWWVRSQDSWHRGDGIIFYEPGSHKETEYRYAGSQDINVWTQGQLNLQQQFSRQTAASGDVLMASGAGANGDVCLFYTAGGTLFGKDNTTGTLTTYGSGSVAFATEPVQAGVKLLIGGVGQIMSAASDASSTTVSTLWTLSGGMSVITPYWTKNRIIATSGSSVWELTLAGGTIPSTPTFLPPESGGTWTAVTEAPDCILASYNCNGRGYVYRISLVESSSAGSTPTLGAFVLVAELPPGEQIYSMKTYLGSFVALGTTLGVRICDLAQNGQMTYGPLTVETTNPVRALAARNHFVYAGVTADNAINGCSGIVRIDLGQEILNFTSTGFASRTLRYAYAYDSAALGTSALVQSVVHNGTTDTLAVGMKDSGVWVQSATAFQSSGYITSGKIRFGTAEAKTFAYLKIRATIPSGTSIAVTCYTPDGVGHSIGTLTQTTDLNQDILLGSIAAAAYPSVQVRFDLATSDSSVSPIIDAWQVKATPLPHIQRQIQMPLRLADWEQDSKNGLRVGAEGTAWTRLSTLESLENAQSLVTISDNTNGETYTAIIQKIEFMRNTPPSRNKSNFGGILLLTVLKI